MCISFIFDPRDMLLILQIGSSFIRAAVAWAILLRGGIEDNSKIIFLIPHENICCDPSLEPFNETFLMIGHKICFNVEILLIIPKLSFIPLLMWSTVINCMPHVHSCCILPILREGHSVNKNLHSSKLVTAEVHVLFINTLKVTGYTLRRSILLFSIFAFILSRCQLVKTGICSQTWSKFFP